MWSTYLVKLIIYSPFIPSGSPIFNAKFQLITIDCYLYKIRHYFQRNYYEACINSIIYLDCGAR